MRPILLTKSPLDLRRKRKTFAVVCEGYPEPLGVPVIRIDELLENRERWLGGDYEQMVVIGLSRMMTPGNRVKLGQVLLRPRPGLRRISVDDLLFVSDPWRMWWHFYAVGKERWGFTDSFLAETRWKAALELLEPCPFGPEQTLTAIRGVVTVKDAFRFDQIAVEVVEVDQSARSEYAKLKERLFDHEKSIHAIIRRLASFAADAAPSRKVPSVSQLFKKPPRRIVRTDLKVDEFLVGELLKRVLLTNLIADFRG